MAKWNYGGMKWGYRNEEMMEKQDGWERRIGGRYSVKKNSTSGNKKAKIERKEGELKCSGDKLREKRDGWRDACNTKWMRLQCYSCSS